MFEDMSDEKTSFCQINILRWTADKPWPKPMNAHICDIWSYLSNHLLTIISYNGWYRPWNVMGCDPWHIQYSIKCFPIFPINILTHCVIYLPKHIIWVTVMGAVIKQTVLCLWIAMFLGEYLSTFLPDGLFIRLRQCGKFPHQVVKSIIKSYLQALVHRPIQTASLDQWCNGDIFVGLSVFPKLE